MASATTPPAGLGDTVGARLRRWRRRAGLSQARLAIEAGCSESLINEARWLDPEALALASIFRESRGGLDRVAGSGMPGWLTGHAMSAVWTGSASCGAVGRVGPAGGMAARGLWRPRPSSTGPRWAGVLAAATRCLV
jgi:hypothetical protein